MNMDQVFQDANLIIEDILTILGEQLKLLKSRGYKYDSRQGLVKKGALYLYPSSINHRILFDEYGTALLEAYIDLFKDLSKKWNETFAQFALRTIHELSFERIQILFDKNISSSKRNKYKLLIWLADYASLSETKENETTYNKLLDDHKNLLTPKEFTFYSTLLARMKTLQPVERYKLIRDARQKINPLQGTLVAETKILPFIRELNILALSSSFSHILHGDVLLLKDIMQLKRKNAQQMRIFWFLLLTGINAINRIGIYLEDSKQNKKIEQINNKFIAFSDFVNQNWAQLEKLNDQ